MTDMDISLPEPDGLMHYVLLNGRRLSAWSEDQVRAIVATEVAKERERIRTAIMAQHAAAKGQHNLYHCLAVELFGDAAIRKGE